MNHREKQRYRMAAQPVIKRTALRYHSGCSERQAVNKVLSCQLNPVLLQTVSASFTLFRHISYGP